MSKQREEQEERTRRRRRDRADVSDPAEGAGASEPAKEKSGGSYNKKIGRLQVELAHLQAWVKKSGARIVIIFEGRDAAGKGGVIKRITERVSPRVFRVVALPAPTDREKSQIYMQRYVAASAGGGRDRDLRPLLVQPPGRRARDGLLQREARRVAFSNLAPRFEAAIVESGITLLKYFLDVSEEEQEKRFRQRIDDPLAAVEAEPDGRRILPALVGLHQRLRRDDPHDRHRGTRRGGSCRPTTRSARASTASRTS